jgi:hypothetical protein
MHHDPAMAPSTVSAADLSHSPSGNSALQSRPWQKNRVARGPGTGLPLPFHWNNLKE